MKAKNILMTLLLAAGAIAAKAAGYPPELALVSQPVLVYNYNSITVYYDVQNIGDYTYRGDICLFLSPDNGYCYAEKYVKVCPGRIKRVAVEIPAYRINPYRTYTIMPYYELGDELYSFTTFEYFEPLGFYWDGQRSERWVVVNVPPRPRYYTRPGTYRYYYDGFRPPMPPPPAYGVAYGPASPPPPLNPMHHTYNYHNTNGGYPAVIHNNTPAPANNNVAPTPTATVRPNPSGGSMSHGNASTNTTTTGSNSGSTNNSGNASTGTTTTGSSSGRTNTSGSVSRPSNSGNANSSGSTRSGSSSSRNSSGSSSRSGSGSTRR